MFNRKTAKQEDVSPTRMLTYSSFANAYVINFSGFTVLRFICFAVISDLCINGSFEKGGLLREDGSP